MIKFLTFIICSFYCCSCISFSKGTGKAANRLLKNKALYQAHTGISIYDVSTGKYIYQYQSDKYFIPASNTKIVTCYTVMKHLGDSLPGLRFSYHADSNIFEIFPTGDPTFMHPDFKADNIFDFYKQHKNDKFYFHVSPYWNELPYGKGWAWDDYEGDYMAERSPYPIYGNVITFKLVENKTAKAILNVSPIRYSIVGNVNSKKIEIRRELNQNKFYIQHSTVDFTSVQIPFITDSVNSFKQLLADSLKIQTIQYPMNPYNYKDLMIKNNCSTIFSKPTDSMLKPMMYRSDNFYAEQSLLMVSNEIFDTMSDEKVIDTILHSDLKDLPEKPNWVDGSGLSRYNLFSPDDFIFILNKMRLEFSMNRIKSIFPSGNIGSLKNYFKKGQNYIYAKTGSMSHVVTLSGFLYTKSKRLLIFSVLVNNNMSSITEVRRAVENFIENIRNLN